MNLPNPTTLVPDFYLVQDMDGHGVLNEGCYSAVCCVDFSAHDLLNDCDVAYCTGEIYVAFYEGACQSFLSCHVSAHQSGSFVLSLFLLKQNVRK